MGDVILIYGLDCEEGRDGDRIKIKSDRYTLAGAADVIAQGSYMWRRVPTGDPDNPRLIFNVKGCSVEEWENPRGISLMGDANRLPEAACELGLPIPKI